MRNLTRIIRKAEATSPKSPFRVSQSIEKGQLLQSSILSPPKHSRRPGGKRPDDPYLHSIRIKQMALKGSLPTALDYYQKRLDCKRMPYNPAIFNTVIDALGHAGRFRQAEKVLRDMKERAVQPDKYTFCSLLNALANNTDLSREAMPCALKYYEEACRTGLQTSFLFNNLLKVVARHGTITELQKIFPHDIKLPNPDKVSYSIALNKLKGSQNVEWLSYYHRLIKDGIEIEGPLLTALLSCVRSSLEAKEGFEIKPFLAVVRKKQELKLFNKDVIPCHYLYLDILRKAKIPGDAIDHYENVIKGELNGRNMDGKILDLVLRLYNSSGNPRRALSEFECFRRQLYYKPSSSSIQSIAEACSLLGRPKCAISYLQGYVVSKRVVPKAGLVLALSSYSKRAHEMEKYYTDQFIPFIEKHYAAVYLEAQAKRSTGEYV